MNKDMYNFVRGILFGLDPETAHTLTMRTLRLGHSLGLSTLFNDPGPSSTRTVMGIDFPNPVGLAAGMDKNGDYLDALSALGFGFIEVGTVTPLPQKGNPRPRLFRLPKAQALINRLGFNNKGVDYLVDRVRRSGYRGVLGISIGKNAITPMEYAVDDYLTCLRKVYPYASYVAVNISSPNTHGLRYLQYRESFTKFLNAIKEEQFRLAEFHGLYVPIAVKIAPDINDLDISIIAKYLVRYSIDAVIATNTTIDRRDINSLQYANESGGLSGKPLMARSTEVARILADNLHGKIPIIASGGVLTGADAREKMTAGASLVQIYTGLIYSGPALIREIIEQFR